jgi:hypothetical protein
MSFESFHKGLIIRGGNKNDELPEQKILYKHIKQDDNVLELGGNIGRASVVINSLLHDKTKHVVVETSKRECITLNTNKLLNNLEYHIFEGAICDQPLIQKGSFGGGSRTQTHNNSIPILKGWVPVTTVSLTNFIKLYNIEFDTIFADVEGALVYLLNSNKWFLSQINKIILEHDFCSEFDLNTFNSLMKEYQFTMIDHVTKKSVNLTNWKAGVLSDPIFVSVWEKQ